MIECLSLIATFLQRFFLVDCEYENYFCQQKYKDKKK